MYEKNTELHCATESRPRTKPCCVETLRRSNNNLREEEEFEIPVKEILPEFIVYPNPANRIVNLQWNNKIEQPVTIIIYDILGKEQIVHGSNLNNGFEIISTDNLISGIYRISITADHTQLFNTSIAVIK